MKTANREKGSHFEKIAANNLQAKGYKILESNFQTRFGEVDIIAAKGECIVFVEVKSKHVDSPGLPEEMISTAKIRKIMQTAFAYLQKHANHKERYPSYRIDLAAIIHDKNNNVISFNHYKNVSPEFF